MVRKDTCTLMFISVPFTIAKTWKQPKCPLTDEWIKMWYIYTMEYYSVTKETNYRYSTKGMIISDVLTPTKAKKIQQLWAKCSHEIKKLLFLGRKATTKLDSMLKNRHITLPTKVHPVKGMVFPVVTYGCKSWTTKKVEGQKIDAFELWSWRRLLKVP